MNYSRGAAARSRADDAPVDGPVGPPRPVFRNLQALRAYAAVNVALFHFALIPAASVRWHHGSFGVDLFFVLSGFIIAHSSKEGSRHFLRRRVIRVLPPYWIATTLSGPLILLAMPVRDALGWYGRSLLFLTGPGGQPPILFVGWTLVYELAFYLVHAAALRIGGKRAPLIAAAILLALAYGARAAGLSARDWPLLIEFAYGLVIFLLVERPGIASGHPGWGAALVVTGVILLHAGEGLVLGRQGASADQLRTLVLGLPATAVVLGLLLLETAGRTVRSPFVMMLGASSYTLYLLHPLVLSFALPLAAGSVALRLTMLAALLAISVGVALGFHYWMEAPVLRRLWRHLGSEGDPPRVVPAPSRAT